MEYKIKELQKIFNALGYNPIQSRNLSKDTAILLDFFASIKGIANTPEIDLETFFTRQNLEILVDSPDSIDKLVKIGILVARGEEPKEYCLNRGGIQNLIETCLGDELKYIFS